MSPTNSLALNTGHIGLNVTDLRRSIPFYQEVFGFDLLHEGGHNDQPFAFLGNGDKLVVTLWQQSRGEYVKTQPGLHHLSFSVPTLETLQEIEARLRSRQTRFAYDGVVPHAEGGQAGALFFFDPDGIRLEIYAPSGGEGKAAPVSGAPSCGFF